MLEDHCLAYTLQEQESKCFMFCFSMLTCPHSYIGLYVSRPADMSCFCVLMLLVLPWRGEAWLRSVDPVHTDQVQPYFPYC